jgi:serine/threonine protein phosphatase PrpC
VKNADISGPLRLSSAGLTDVGRKRTNNEDAFIAEPELGLYAVADGMGGHAGGEVAAQMAIEALRSALPSAPDADFVAQPTLANRRRLLEWLVQTVQSINAAIHTRAQDDFKLRGMGCTLDVALIRGGGVFTAHVGDSRIYILRSGTVYQLTEDHTFAQMLLANGVLSKEEVAKHPQRNMLTRGLGPFPSVQVDSAFFELDAGDVFLLCSDGLYVEVPEERIAALLTQPPETATRELIQAGLEAGGRDNMTAVVFQVMQSPQQQLGIIGAEKTRRALARSSLFAAFTESELMRVQKIALGRLVPPGETVVAQGSAVDELYLVMEGEMSVVRDGEPFGKLGPGDPFGAMALNHDPDTEVSLRTDTLTQLLVFPLTEIKTLLASDTAIAAKLALAALERVHQRHHRVIDSYSRYRRDNPAR